MPNNLPDPIATADAVTSAARPMRVLDPGHKYTLPHFDGDGFEVIAYVKREGAKYPGNVGSYSGTNLQSGWRAEIDRLKYLNTQEACQENYDCINWLRHCILSLEQRAARRHGRELPALSGWIEGIEDLPTCGRCGHIGCAGEYCLSANAVKPEPTGSGQ